MKQAKVQISIDAFIRDLKNLEPIEGEAKEAALLKLCNALRDGLFSTHREKTARQYLYYHRVAVGKSFPTDHPAIALLQNPDRRGKPQAASAAISPDTEQGGSRKRGALQRALAKLIDDLSAARSQEDIKSVCAAAIASIREHQRPSSVKQYLYIYRNHVKQVLGGDHPSIAFLVYSAEEAGRQAGKAPAPAATNVHPLPPASRLPPVAPPPPVDPSLAPRQSTATAADKVTRREIAGVGRRASGQVNIAEFLKRIRDVESADELKMMWEEEFKKYSHLTVSTQSGYVSKYRNAIRNEFGQDASTLLDIVVAPEEVWKAKAAENRRRILSMHTAQVGIRYWREIIARAETLLDAPDPVLIGIGLIVLTGRRPVEIFTSAKFERVPLLVSGGRAFDKWHVKFSGQAKTRERPGTQFGQVFEIPCLTPAANVVNAWARLRSHPKASSIVARNDGNSVRMVLVRWDELTTEEFDSEFRSVLTPLVQEHFLDLWPINQAPLTAKSFRALYAEIATRTMKPVHLRETAYYAAVLGHSVRRADDGTVEGQDLETAHAYMKFYLMSGDPQVDAAALASSERIRADARRSAAERLATLGLTDDFDGMEDPDTP